MKPQWISMAGVWVVVAALAVGVPLRAESENAVRAAMEAKDALAAHRAARAWVEAEPGSAKARLALALTYAEVDAPVATVEHARAGLRLAPDAATARALRRTAALAHTRLGQADAAWVALLAATPDLLAAAPADQVALTDAYGSMVARPAWDLTLERVAREAEAGAPGAVARLAALTDASGDRVGAQALARRGLERSPADRVLNDEWLCLLVFDPTEGLGELTDERAAALYAKIAAAEKAGAEGMRVAQVRAVLFDAGWSERPFTPGPAIEPVLKTISAEVARFEKEARTNLPAARSRAKQAEEKLYALIDARAAKEDLPGASAWWQAQLDALAVTDREHRQAMAVIDDLIGRADRLNQAIGELAGADLGAVEALLGRLQAAVMTGVAPPDPDADVMPPLRAGYDVERAFMLADELRAGRALAILAEALADRSLKPAARLAATDDALAAGAVSARVWRARALAARDTGDVIEAGFAAVRALQESLNGDAPMTEAEATELRAVVAANLKVARDAADAALAAVARGEWEPALAAAARAFAQDPLCVDAWRARLLVGRRLGDEALALEALRMLWRAEADEVLDWRDAMNLACRASDWPLLFSLAEAACEAEPTLIDAWYFRGLAARALLHDHLAGAIGDVLKPSPWSVADQWAEKMVAHGSRAVERHFYVQREITDTLGRADEPPGLRLWLAWVEGGRGALGNVDAALRARLLNGSPDDAHVKRLLGQTSADDYAQTDAAKKSPATAAWVEGVLAKGRGDQPTMQRELARAAADAALPVDLRAMAARWSGASKGWLPWRSTDVFHLTPALDARGVLASQAAPGQLVLLSTSLTVDSYAAEGSRRIRGATKDAMLYVRGTVSLERSNEASGDTVVARPRVWEWENLKVAKVTGASGAPILSVGPTTQISLRRVDARQAVETDRGVAWSVAGVLDVHEGSALTPGVDVASGGLWLARDAAWSVGAGSIAGRAEFRGGHLGLPGDALVVAKGGVLALAELSATWKKLPAVQDGGAMTWRRVLGLGDVGDAGVAARWTSEGSRLVGSWPAGASTPAGLTLYAIAGDNAGAPILVANDAELAKAAREAKPGDVIQLTGGVFKDTAGLVLPAGVTLDGGQGKFYLSIFGGRPVFRVKGPGAVRFKNVRVEKNDEGGVYEVTRSKRSLIEATEGAVVVISGGWLDFNTFSESDPSLRLRGGSTLFVSSRAYLRGSASLDDGSELQLVGMQTDNIKVAGVGRLLLAGLEDGMGIAASGSGLRVAGSAGQATLSLGAGGERDIARQQLLRKARDGAWERAAQAFKTAYAAASNLEQRGVAAATFRKAVLTANDAASAADAEAGEFAWIHLKPVYLARPDEAPYLDLVTYPVFGPRLRSDADVGPAVVAARNAYRQARKLTKANEGTAEFDRAVALARAFPPGSADYAMVESAFQRGLTAEQFAAECRERARQQAELEATRERVRRAEQEAALRRYAALNAQTQQQPRFTPRSAGASGYVTSYGGSSSTPMPPQWTPSQSAQNAMYNRQLEVTIRQNVFGR